MTLDEALVQLEEDVALLRIVIGHMKLYPPEESAIISASSKVHSIYEAIEDYLESDPRDIEPFPILRELGVPGYE
jgi:hypothetical protein